MTTEQPIEERLSYGNQLVGLTFNPSNDPNVQRAKELCAELATMVRDHWQRDLQSQKSSLENTLYHHTIGEILNAQMNVVKFLTFKY
jgi:hypothetical protein